MGASPPSKVCDRVIGKHAAHADEADLAADNPRADTVGQHESPESGNIRSRPIGTPTEDVEDGVTGLAGHAVHGAVRRRNGLELNGGDVESLFDFEDADEGRDVFHFVHEEQEGGIALADGALKQFVEGAHADGHGAAAGQIGHRVLKGRKVEKCEGFDVVGGRAINGP